MSFPVSPKFKESLEVAAASENRSLTNVLETLVVAYCEQHGLSVSPRQGEPRNGDKK